MEAPSAPLNLSTIITAVVVFLFVDLILRQVLDKMSLTSQYKVDSLVNAIRPVLQILEKAIADKKIEEKDKTDLISLINKIKPMPLKSILTLAEEIPTGEIDDDKKIRNLHEELVKLKKSSVRFVSTYMMGFGSLETAGPISALIGLLSVCVCWGWIPSIILAFYGVISWWVVATFVVLAVIYEFYIRKEL
jgi:hypothetical protein